MDSSTILKRLKIIDDLSKEMNILKEQFQDALEGDAHYQDHMEKIKQIKEDQKVEKDLISTRVLEKPAIKSLKDEIKQKSDDIRDNRDVLGQELADYYKETGSLEIKDTDGTVKKLKFSVKLIS